MVVTVINSSGDKSPDFCLYDPLQVRAQGFRGKGSLPAHGVTVSRHRCTLAERGRQKLWWAALYNCSRDVQTDGSHVVVQSSNTLMYNAIVAHFILM